MKKLLPLIALIVGVFLGWAIAYFQMDKKWIKISSTFTPEFQSHLTKSYQDGILIQETLSEDEIMSVLTLANKSVNNWKCQVFGKAFEAVKIRKYIANENIDAVVKSSDAWINRFLKLHEEGAFKNDYNEKMADGLAEVIKNANFEN